MDSEQQPPAEERAESLPLPREGRFDPPHADVPRPPFFVLGRDRPDEPSP